MGRLLVLTSWVGLFGYLIGSVFGGIGVEYLFGWTIWEGGRSFVLICSVISFNNAEIGFWD